MFNLKILIYLVKFLFIFGEIRLNFGEKLLIVKHFRLRIVFESVNFDCSTI